MDRNVVGDVMGKALAESLSARRAWIEISLLVKLRTWKMVALRKESVDRNTKTVALEDPESGRSPQGERG